MVVHVYKESGAGPLCNSNIPISADVVHSKFLTFISSGRTPTIQELFRLVASNVAADWEKLAIMLEFDEDGHTIKAIQRDLWGQGVHACCMQALHLWLRGKGKHPVTWDTLIECLVDIDCVQLTRNIKEHFLKKDDSQEHTSASGNYLGNHDCSCYCSEVCVGEWY